MPGDPNRKWGTIIVVSDNEPGLLPRSMKRGELFLYRRKAIVSLVIALLAGAIRLCVVQSNLDQVQEREFEEYSKRCWEKGKHHFVARFSVKVIISPADLKFEASILSSFQAHSAPLLTSHPVAVV
jgi:hypothetical protein